MASITSDSTAKSIDRQGESSLSLHSVLEILGSLKFTVALFAISLVLVLVGTLAQDEMNMLDVKNRYFLAWIAWLHFDDFFPQAFLRHENPIPGIIPFPGGALVGVLLMFNLVAAKWTRFRLQASGGKAVLGGAFMVAGALLATVVIVLGQNSEGLQGTPPMAYETLWALILATLTVIACGLVMAAVKTSNRNAKLASVIAASVIAIFIVYALVSGFRIGDPGLRIVWQLTKGLGAGLVLMVGCLLLFGKQGGNVLLHLGVGLLMLGQFMFGDRQQEQRLSLVEGQSSNTMIDLDSIEFTFVKSTDTEKIITAIPGTRLTKAAADESLISDPALPVDVRVLAFYDNSSLVDVKGDNLANAGVGLEIQANPLAKIGGTDNRMNLAAGYVELLSKSSGESLGRYLVSQSLSDREVLVPDGSTKDLFDKVTIDGTEYQIGLRLHRLVKPYWVQLEDVRRVDYSGSNTVRDYSSFIRIVDSETGEDRKERVWMNNPLRYRGETFYQSNYTPLPGGKEMTGLQVVRNSGWLIPYVACSITALGMLVHFSGTLGRFLRRRQRENRRELGVPNDHEDSFLLQQPAGPSQWPVAVGVAGFALFASFMLVPWDAVMNAYRPSTRATEYDFHTAGKIPVQFGGRVMPLDSYARQTLKSISNKESLKLDPIPDSMKARVKDEKLSAMQWLMEVAIDTEALRGVEMFRIDAEEVRSELELERRQSKLYSLNEISKNFDRVSDIVDVAAKKEPADQSFKEKKLIELDHRTRQYTLTAAAFRLPMPPEIPAELFPEGTSLQARQMFALRELQRQMEALSQMPAPAIIPPEEKVASTSVDQPTWSAFSPAFFEMAKSRVSLEVPANPGIDSFSEMLKSYGDHDTAAFNQAVDTHLAGVQSFDIPGYDLTRVSLERWMQSNWPTGVAMVLYIMCVVLGLVYFCVDLPRLRQVVWGTLAVALAIHTVALFCRIYITGRAPVINLYSSAVFIGWAAVLFGLVVERIFRRGTGNMLSATAGMLTLLVAYGLSTGDTMPVLQAVLDTQFWLATHVISVTLGYVATMVAGILGIGYLVAMWIGKDKTALRDLYRVCYGAACFGILFSFVGTVLGGLWADDSWGRFWGWDPKENGALLIVIWNALMLHARWDGMVAAKGFSILAIGGNIVTAWSWFGTNELGIGLHSYGFTSGVLMWLSIFIGVQLVFIIAGIFTPKSDSVALD